MTGKIVDDPLVANPGDPDLDLHLSGLLIASYLMLPAGPDAAEFMIAYHTSLATGWWLTPLAGRFVPERVTAASHTFIVSGPACGAAAERLRLWYTQGRRVAWTSAPGKRCLLRTAGPADSQLLVVRRGLPGTRRASGERDSM
jgi:hypothetical protein